MKRDGAFTKLLRTRADRGIILIRLVVGIVFISEGIQKFLFPETLGTGRFEKIGFVDPAFWAYFTACFEIVCGSFIIFGLFTRMAAIPLLGVMSMAFYTTKFHLLLNQGFWAFMHEYRTDFAMTMLLIYLLIFGAGKWSLDAVIAKIIRNINWHFLPK